jgi:hypothetical protein
MPSRRARRRSHDETAAMSSRDTTEVSAGYLSSTHLVLSIVQGAPMAIPVLPPPPTPDDDLGPPPSDDDIPF